MPDTPLVTIAPALNGRPSLSAPANEQTMSLACVQCARRKVKCDKIAPICSACRRGSLFCEWQEPTARKPKKRKLDDDAINRLCRERYGSDVPTLQGKVARLEKLLNDSGLMPSGGSESQLQSPVDLQEATESLDRSGLKAKKGKLLNTGGKTRYIDNDLWHHLNEAEVDVDQLNQSAESEDEADLSPLGGDMSAVPDDPISAALTGPSSPSSNLLEYHPIHHHATKLWNLYIENVDPIVKVVHVPSTAETVERGARDPGNASRSTLALLFAIYHFAIISATDAQCLEIFGESHATLKARYHKATRQALVDAHFLKATDLTVFQAYILFLVSIRGVYDPHTFWILTGVAVRIGHGLGIHRDGEDLDLGPFDVELRRRIFWQLIPLEALSAQMTGTTFSMSSDSWDVKQPLNINDSDIWPGMVQPPEPRIGATDMIFCLARTEIGKFHKKAYPSLSGGNWATVSGSKDVPSVEAMMTDLEEVFEMKYLRYCDIANPLHCLTMVMCRATSTFGRLRVRLSLVKHNKAMSDEERGEIRTLTMKIIDYYTFSEQNPTIAQFHWHLYASLMWDPLVWILNDVCKDPVSYLDGGLWTKVESLYDSHPEIFNLKKPLHLAMGRLTLKAWDTWGLEKTRRNQLVPNEPTYIIAFRNKFDQRTKGRSSGITPLPTNHTTAESSADNSVHLTTLPTMMPNLGSIDFSSMLDPSLDSEDWMFWDQLISDPNAFSVI